MEDIFKVIFYSVAVSLWILYKYREQKKSGMWKPRTSGIPEAEKPKPPPVKVQRSPLKKAVVKPSFTRKNADYAMPIEGGLSQENLPVSEKYDTSFMRSLTTLDNSPAESMFQEEEAEVKPFKLDIRQAIIGSEILKRPKW